MFILTTRFYRHALPLIGSAFLLACTDSANTPAVNEADIVAKVNDEVISRSTLQHHSENRGSGDAPQDQANAIEELINLTLLKQEAVRQGIDKNPDVLAEIDRQRTAVLANQLIQNKTLEQEVSESDLQQEYDRQVASMPKEYRARHILVKEEAEAKAIIEQLNAGADFAKLAAEKSTDSSASNGGDLDWFHLETMVPEFSNAVAKLEKGQISSAPVKSEYGWHIIRLDDIRELPKPDFETVREQVKRIVMNNRLRDFMETLRKQANIEIKPAMTHAETADDYSGHHEATPNEQNN